MRLSIFFVMLIIASVQLFAQVQDSDAEGWKQDGIEFEIGNVAFDYKLRENPGDTTLYKYFLEGVISFDFFLKNSDVAYVVQAKKVNGSDGRFSITPYRLENPAEGEMLHYYQMLSTQSWYMIRAASYEDGVRSLINLTDTIYATDLVSPEDRDLIFYGKSTSGVESISRNDSALRSVHTSSGMMFSVDGDCIQSVAVYDLSGKLTYFKKIVPSSFINVDKEHLAPGINVIEIKTSSRKRIVKKLKFRE